MMRCRAIYKLAAVVFLFPIGLGAQETRLGSLPLYYDARDGNVTIDTTDVAGGVFFAYIITAPPCCSLPLRHENHTPFMNTTFVDSNPDTIGETNFQELEGGVYSLGAIFPSGLTEDELLSTYFDGGGGPRDGRKYHVRGRLGGNSYHLLQPIYSGSPFPTINDASVGFAPVERWAEAVSLGYNSVTGELTVDSTGDSGGAIWSYQIEFSSDVVDLDAFTPATELISASVRPNSLTEVGFSSIPEGVHGLGPVLPVSLTPSEFSSLVERAFFIGEPGTGVNGLDFDVRGIAMSLAVVPEPSALYMGLVAMVIVSSLRQRPHVASRS